MNKEHIDKLAWIYINDRKILVTRSKGKDVCYIPGGKREKGETDKQALIREIKEELSVDLIPESLRFSGIFKAQANGKPEGVIVQMTCYEGKFTGELKANAEIEDVVWFPRNGKNFSGRQDNLWLAKGKRQD